MKKILILILSLFFISLVSASFGYDDGEKVGIFKRNDCIDLTQSCSNCTYNNLTSIIYPNGTRSSFSPEQNMTKSGTDYLFHTCNFSSQYGGYIVNGYGDLDGSEEVWNYNYEITQTGRVFGTSQVLGSLGIFIGVLAVAFVFLFIGSKLSKEDKTLPVGFFFSVMAVILVIYSLHLAWIFSVDILQHEIISQGVSTIFVIVLWSSVGIAIIFFALMLIAFIKELGKILKTKKFGEDFNPISDTYE